MFENITVTLPAWEEAAWKPANGSQHVGTGWVPAANPNHIRIIFWICVTHLIFALISILYARCRSLSKAEIDHLEMQGGKRIAARKYVHSPRKYDTHLFKAMFCFILSY